MMFTTERIAKAKDRYHYKFITFYWLNHLTAIFVGAFKINGCAMAHNICPTITNAKCVEIKHLNPEPIAVKIAPITIPFFIPLTSKTQLEGKLIKT